MATYAIGDIHGRFDALCRLLVELDPFKDRLIFLGDYVDRGPDSYRVLELLIALAEESKNAVFLRGNHDWMMMDSRTNPAQKKHWLEKCGGKATLQSYGKANINSIPKSHWNFLNTTCRDAFESTNHIFIHGGLEPDLPVVQQAAQTLYWRRIFDAAPHISGKRVVCGHTQQASGMPINLDHTVCIDTRNWLTALNVNANTFKQANQAGQFREFKRLPPIEPVPPKPLQKKKALLDSMPPEVEADGEDED